MAHNSDILQWHWSFAVSLASWSVGYLDSVSVFSLFPALLSDAPTLSSGSCCKPNSPPVVAILVVFSRDPFVDTVCEQQCGEQLSIQLEISNNAEYDWQFEGCSDLQQSEGLLYASYSSQTMAVHCTFHPMIPDRENEIILPHIPAFFGVCSNWRTRILDRCSPLFGLWL